MKSERFLWVRGLVCFIALLVFTACSTIDCPLNNAVYAKCQLAGEETPMGDTLYVCVKRADGTDSLVLNRAVDFSDFLLPMSYARETDAYYLRLVDVDGREAKDTIRVTKENHPHFEAVDCAPSVFHTITGATTTHHAIEDIEISNQDVNYDATKVHLLIYFKSDRF